MQLDYEVEPGEGHTRNDLIKEQGIKTYLIVRRINNGDDVKISGASQVCNSRARRSLFLLSTCAKLGFPYL